MSEMYKREQRPPRARPILAGVALALALGALAVAPAAGSAAVKFGAKLGGDPDPVNVAEQCPDGSGYCTRAPLHYEDPSHVGPTLYAPEDGVIDKIKLVSETQSQFIPQVVKVKGNIAGHTKLRVVAEDPVIVYEGTGEIETFDVDMPVNEGQRVAMRTQYAGALQCEPGIDQEAIADPLLSLASPLTKANYYTGCTHLVQAVMEE